MRMVSSRVVVVVVFPESFFPNHKSSLLMQLPSLALLLCYDSNPRRLPRLISFTPCN